MQRVLRAAAPLRAAAARPLAPLRAVHSASALSSASTGCVPSAGASSRWPRRRGARSPRASPPRPRAPNPPRPCSAHDDDHHHHDHRVFESPYDPMGPPRACRASLPPPPASLGDRAVALPSAQARAALLSYCPPPPSPHRLRAPPQCSSRPAASLAVSGSCTLRTPSVRGERWAGRGGRDRCGGSGGRPLSCLSCARLARRYGEASDAACLSQRALLGAARRGRASAHPSLFCWRAPPTALESPPTPLAPPCRHVEVHAGGEVSEEGARAYICSLNGAEPKRLADSTFLPLLKGSSALTLVG